MEIVRGDLADQASLDRAAEGCARIVHLAALTSSSESSTRELEATNVVGTANIARAAARAGAQRLVHVSTCGVYGFGCRSPVAESAPLRPDTPYRRSKVRGEGAVIAASRQTGLPVVIARLGIVYGPGSRSWVRLCQTLLDGSFRSIGDGRNRIHPGHVSDIVEGIVACALTPGVDGCCYNLAGPDAIAMAEMVAILGRALGVPPRWRSWPALPFSVLRYVDLARARMGARVRRLPSYDFFLADRTFDLSRARTELGYEPRVSAARGLAEIVAHYRTEGLLERV